MSSIVSRLLGCGDLPDRSSASSFVCTRHAMRVCRAHRTYARHTVEMRLDRDRDSLAARSRHDSGLPVVYHTSTAAIHPSAALRRISILLRAGRNFDAFAAVMTSGKNPHAKPTATYMYSTRRLMSDGLDREQETLVYCANS
jgi:hypothetical protein